MLNLLKLKCNKFVDLINRDAKSEESRVKTWLRVHDVAGQGPALPLTVSHMTRTTTKMRLLGYRSAANNLRAAKKLHIKSELSWTAALQQGFNEALIDLPGTT